MTNEEAKDVAESYYDSDDADRFYFTIWGGEDIHVGLYDTTSDIFTASRYTVEDMARRLGDIGPDTRIIDLGAGYGGAARYLAKTFGCFVACLNISEAQNARNVKLNKEQGLDHLVEVRHGTFEDVPYEDESFDVVWSQDSFLHSDQRRKCVEETWRILKPGGQLIFTDPMQADDCPEGVLGPILDRLHLPSLGSIGFYRQVAREIGFEEIEIDDMSRQLPRHYGRVREELKSRYEELTQAVSKEYCDRMLNGLQHWVDGGNAGHLAWGILHFRKPA